MAKGPRIPLRVTRKLNFKVRVIGVVTVEGKIKVSRPDETRKTRESSKKDNSK